MKKIVFALIVTIVLTGIIFLLTKSLQQKNNFPAPTTNVTVNTSTTPENQNQPQETPTTPAPAANQSQYATTIPSTNEFAAPLDRTSERVTKKPFGIYITSKTSPVQPERFQGYHTGTDFEIFPEEINTDVTVHAICTGKIAVKKIASGYGGVLVQACQLDNQPITVIYGHLKLSSITKNAGDTLNADDEIGILGKAYSSETDGERKHLHLGIHKGSSISILGYVQSQSQLSGWIDPCTLVCK
jgi:hypothetical protein